MRFVQILHKTYQRGDFMKQNNEKPTTGEILRDIRKAKGLSQTELGQKVLSDHATISKMEKGERNYTSDLLKKTKKALGVEGLPLNDKELENYRVKLREWHHTISERDWVKAKEMQKNLAVIKFMPYEKELNALYDLHKCRHLIGLGELDAAKPILESFDIRVNELKNMSLYHYYYNKGTYAFKKKHNSEALDFYMKAYAFIQGGMEKDITLYFYIAHCCERLGFVFRAIAFLREAHELLEGNKYVSEFYIYNYLAILYIQTGHLQDAKKLLDICITNAKDIRNKHYKGLALLNHGFLYRVGEDWDIALEYLDEAFEYLDKGNRNYLEAFYQKITCMIEAGYTSDIFALLTAAEKRAEGDEEYTIHFKALGYMCIPTKPGSLKYLESVAIPYMLENGYYCAALDYCKFLRRHYKKRPSKYQSRALKIAQTICDINDRMLEGGVLK